MAFMDKLGEIGDAISSKGKEAANKAKEMNGVSSLKAKISKSENSMKEVYAELGEKMFAEHADWIGEHYSELLEKVNGFQAEIEQYNKDIENLKQTTADANAAIQEAQKARAAKSAADVAAKRAAAAAAAAQKAQAAAQQAEIRRTQSAQNQTMQADPVLQTNVASNMVDANQPVKDAQQHTGDAAQDAETLSGRIGGTIDVEV